LAGSSDQAFGPGSKRRLDFSVQSKPANLTHLGGDEVFGSPETFEQPAALETGDVGIVVAPLHAARPTHRALCAASTASRIRVKRRPRRTAGTAQAPAITSKAFSLIM
jgi:hypothetical protein